MAVYTNPKTGQKTYIAPKPISQSPETKSTRTGYNPSTGVQEGVPNSEKVYTQPGSSGFYYSLDGSPAPKNFQEVKGVTKTGIEEVAIKSGGNRVAQVNLKPSKAGDVITATSLPPVGAEGRTDQYGVMTITPKENQLYGISKTSSTPFWITKNETPSEAVRVGSYAGDVPLRTTPYGQTAGTYESNIAAIDVFQKASLGVDITPKEIFKSQQLARASRESVDWARNVRLTSKSIGVWGTQQVVGFTGFNLNLLGLAGYGKWGTGTTLLNKSNFLRGISNAPSTPKVSSGFVGYLKELPSRPDISLNYALVGSSVYAIGYSGWKGYKIERAAGASKLGALNVVSGEFVSSFSPYGKIQTGVIGTSVSTGKTQQTFGEIDTVKLGQSGNKNLFQFKGGANYKTPETFTYGSVKTTLTRGTIPKITSIPYTNFQTVVVGGYGEAPIDSQGKSYFKGVKSSTIFGNEVYQNTRYTFTTRPTITNQVVGFKGWSPSITSGKASVSTSNIFYTSESNLLTNSRGLNFGKTDLEITGSDYKLTKGRSKGIATGDNTVQFIRARTTYLEPLGSQDFSGGVSESSSSGGTTTKSLKSFAPNIPKNLLGTSTLSTPKIISSPSLGGSSSAGQIGITSTSTKLGSSTSFIKSSTFLSPSIKSTGKLGPQSVLNKPVTISGGVTNQFSSQKVTTILVPSPITSTTFLSPSIISPFSGSPRPLRSVNRTEEFGAGFVPPTLPGFDFGNLGTRRFGGGRKLGYAPDFKSLIFGIKGKAPKKSGIFGYGESARPIISGGKKQGFFKRLDNRIKLNLKTKAKSFLKRRR